MFILIFQPQGTICVMQEPTPLVHQPTLRTSVYSTVGPTQQTATHTSWYTRLNRDSKCVMSTMSKSHGSTGKKIKQFKINGLF